MINQQGKFRNPSRRSRLSLFQRTMLLWNRLHSYNAVHVVHIPNALNAKHLELVASEVLQRAGVSSLKVLGKKYFQYLDNPGSLAIRVLPETNQPEKALRAEIETELNRVFDLEHEFTPFRLFALPLNEGFYLGLSYCHFVADADAISRLLTQIAKCYTGGLKLNQLEPLEIYPQQRQALRSTVLKYMPGWLASFPRLMADLLTTAKPLYANKNDHENGLLLEHISPAEFAQLHQLSKKWNVTLNELFLAILIQALRPLAQERVRGRRKNLSISSIFSYRKDLPPENQNAFGLFLGSFRVHEPIHAQRNLEELAQAIHQQSQQVKKRKLYLACGLELKVGLMVLSLCAPRRQQKLYRQHYPLWGGITNMNLNELSRSESQTISEYFRAVSTGPVCPLVLALTTYGDRLNIALSYRKTVYRPEIAEKILGDFLQCVQMYTRVESSPDHSQPSSVPSCCS